jgi:hypothetical protein
MKVGDFGFCIIYLVGFLTGGLGVYMGRIKLFLYREKDNESIGDVI